MNYLNGIAKITKIEKQLERIEISLKELHKKVFEIRPQILTPPQLSCFDSRSKYLYIRR